MSTVVDERVVSMQFDNSDFEKNVKTSMSTLDKFKRKLKFDDSADSFNNLERSANKVKFQGLNDELDNLKVKINGWSLVASSVINSIVNKVVNAGSKIVSALTINSVAEGWEKYNNILNTTHTLMSAIKTDDLGNAFANEASKLEYVKEYIDAFNVFSDETSTNNESLIESFQKFIAAGIKAGDAKDAIIGLNNSIMLAGGTAQTASHLMIQLTQALGAGYMRAEDWKSFETAGVVSEDFMQLLIDAAVAEGTLIEENGKYYTVLNKTKKALDGVDSSLKTYVNGTDEAVAATTKAQKGIEVSTQNFRSTLTEGGWLTNDVLTSAGKMGGSYASRVLELSADTGYRMLTTKWNKLVTKYAESLGTAGEEATKESVIAELVEELGITADKAREYMEELSDSEYDYGRNAFMAAQQTKTLNEVMEAGRLAAASKWANTFEKIVGDYLEARELMSDLVERVYTAFVTPADYITKIFEVWHNLHGRKLLFDVDPDNGVVSAYENLISAFEEIFDFETGALTRGFLDFYESIHGTFGESRETIDRLNDVIGHLGLRLQQATKKFRNWTATLIPSEETADAWSNIFHSVLSGFDIVIKVAKSVRDALKPVRDLVKGLLSRLFIGIGDSESLLIRLDNFLNKSGVLEKVSSFIADKLSIITDFILKIVDALSSNEFSFSISGIIDSIKTMLSTLFTFENETEEAGSSFADFIKNFQDSSLYSAILKFIDLLGKVWNVIYEVGVTAFSFITDVLDKVFSLFSKEDLIAFKDKLVEIFGVIIDGIKKAFNSSEGGVDFMSIALKFVDLLNTLLNTTLHILDAIFPILKRILNWITAMVDKLSDAKVSAVLGDAFKIIADSVLALMRAITGNQNGTALEVFSDFVKLLAEPLTNLASFSGTLLNQGISALSDLTKMTGDFLSNFLGALSENLPLMNKIGHFITRVMRNVGWIKFAEGIKAFGEWGYEFGRAGRAWAKAFQNSSDIFGFRARARNRFIEALMGLAIVLTVFTVVMAGIIYLFRDIDPKTLLAITGTISIAVIAMGTAVAALALIAYALTKDQKVSDVKQMRRILEDMTSVILALSASALIMAFALEKIDNLLYPWKSAIILVGMMVVLVGAFIALGKTYEKIGAKHMIGIVLSMTIVVGLLAVLANMLEWVSTMSFNLINIGALLVTFAVVSGLLALVALIKPNKVLAAAGAMAIASLALIGVALALKISVDSMISFSTAIEKLSAQSANLQIIFDTIRSVEDIKLGSILKWAIIMAVMASTLKNFSKNTEGISNNLKNIEQLQQVLEILSSTMDNYGSNIMKWIGIAILASVALLFIGMAGIAVGAASIALGAGLAIMSGSLMIFAKAIDMLAKRTDKIKDVINTFCDLIDKRGKTLWILIGMMAALGIASIFLGSGLGAIAVSAVVSAAAIWLIGLAIEFFSKKLEYVELVVKEMARLMKEYGVTMLEWIGIGFLASIVLLLLAGAAVGLAVAFFIASLAFILFGAGLYLVAGGLEKLAEAFDKIDVDKASEIVDRIFERLRDMIPNLVTNFIRFGVELLKQINEDEQIEDLIAQAVELLISIFLGAIRGITRKIEDIVDAVVDFIVTCIEAVANTVNKNGSRIDEAMDKLMVAMINLVLTALGFRGKLRTMLSEGIVGMINSIQDLIAKSAAKLGINIAKGLELGIEDGVPQVNSTFERLVGGGMNALARKAEIQSPSKVMRRFGQYLDEGLVLGLNDYAGECEGAAEEVADATLLALIAAYDLIENGVDQDPTIRPVLDLTNIQNGMDSMNGMLAGDYTINASARYAQSVADAEYNATTGVGDSGTSTTTNNNSQTISNTFNISGDDPREIAEEVSRIIQQQIGRRNTVWA